MIQWKMIKKRLGKEINAKALLGIHWGTIELSDENPWEPPKRFKESAQTLGFWLLYQ